MFKFVRSAGLLAGLMLAAPTAAANITAQQPNSVIEALQKAGYKALMKADRDGDPYIESSSNGSKFLIFFMNCTKNVDCRTVQFFVGYDDYKGSLEKLNQWNAENRFGKAYRSDKGAAWLEMDVDLDDGGLSPALFEDNLEFWDAVMGKFAKFVAEVNGAAK